MAMIPLVDVTALMLHQAQVAAASTVAGAGVDVLPYEGPAIVIVNADAVSGTTPTLDVKIQESDTSGGTYTDVTGAAITQVTTVDSLQVINLGDIGERKRWLRSSETAGGTSPVYNLAVILVAQLKSK